jgi:GntR family transcriptional regulator
VVGAEPPSQCATVIHTLLDVNLDRNDPAHLHEQVAAEIRRAIADGEAKPGDRLPPARHLAAVMGVNTNTALRALRALRDEGLLEMAPRRGIRVVGTPAQSEVRTKIAELVQLARRQGYTRAELLQMLADSLRQGLRPASEQPRAQRPA